MLSAADLLAAQQHNWPDTPPVPGYVGWWDAADLATLFLSGRKANTWKDKGSGGHNMTQGTDANRPAIGAWPLIPELPCLVFAGNQLLVSGTFSQGPSLTVISVAIDTATTGFARGVFSADPGSGAGRVLQHRWANQAAPEGIGFTVGAGAAKIATGSGSDCTAPRVFATALDSAGQTVTNYVDGKQNGQLTATGTLNTATAAVAAGVGTYSITSSFWQGWIAEIVYYASALSTSDRNRVEQYLRSKWWGV